MRQLDKVIYRNIWPGTTLEHATGGGIAQSRYPRGCRYHLRGHTVALQRSRRADGGRRFKAEVRHRSDAGECANGLAGSGRSEDSGTGDVTTTGWPGVGFGLGEHDPELPVEIDPVLTWNTFLGSPGGEWGRFWPE